jgi:hypothetical protein
MPPRYSSEAAAGLQGASRARHAQRSMDQCLTAGAPQPASDSTAAAAGVPPIMTGLLGHTAVVIGTPVVVALFLALFFYRRHRTPQTDEDKPLVRAAGYASVRVAGLCKLSRV